MKSLAEVIADHAAHRPELPAFIDGDERLTWSQYAERSEQLARLLVQLGLAPGERLAVLLPDGPDVHVAFVAAEKAGLVVMGIGPRAGEQEIRHLLAVSGASALLSHARHRDLDTAELARALRSEGLPLRRHIVSRPGLGSGEALQVDDVPTALSKTHDELPNGLPERLSDRRLGTDDVFLLNSTSGTTGMPKCVVHDQARWLYFHELAVEAADLDASDVFLSALPAPFGFGIWTGHVSPTLLGAPTVLLSAFSAEEMIRRIERHRVSVLAAVSTQFIMMLDSPLLERADLRSLRVLFTGGEAVPRARAEAFEERTGARVLQFYGSNETGALSCTSLRDTREVRLSTAGHIIPGMQVRLFDEAGSDVTSSGRGIPGCKGPATSRGYYGDPAANAALYSRDGWMLTGDIATLDSEGVLCVVGRVADFIIRGGKNISGPAVEEAVAAHPAVAIAAAVAMPDPVFGERVCVYVELRPGRSLELEELTKHLEEHGSSRESLPERLVVLDALPRSSGGKIAKQLLRDDICARIEQERDA